MIKKINKPVRDSSTCSQIWSHKFASVFPCLRRTPNGNKHTRRAHMKVHYEGEQEDSYVHVNGPL